MTDGELDRLQALADEATAGPWEYHDRGTNYDWDVTGPRCLDLSGYVKGMFWNRENAAFTAASRDAIPALIAEVRRLREENAEMQITISRYQDGELAFLQDYIDSKRRAANG